MLFINIGIRFVQRIADPLLDETGRHWRRNVRLHMIGRKNKFSTFRIGYNNQYMDIGR